MAEKSWVNQSPLYTPSSAEKKRSVLMYLLLGIIVSLQKSELSVFEYFHLRQALGWWLIFVAYLVPFVLVLILPIFGLIVWLLMIALLSVWWLFIKQARDGKYAQTVEMSMLPIFVWLGSRILTIFDITFVVTGSWSVWQQ